MIAHGVRSSVTENQLSTGPPGPSSARNALPTTTVGSTNGTVTSARTSPLPGKSNRASRYVPGSATASVIPVDAAACQSVNQSTCSSSGSPSTPSAAPSRHCPSERSPVETMLATG